MINLLDYIDGGGRVCLGAYIADCSLKGTPGLGFTYQIVSKGEPYTIILVTAISGASHPVSIKCKSMSDISKVEIKKIIEAYWDCFDDSVKLNWENIRILEPDEIIEFYRKHQNTLEHMFDCKEEKI